MDFVVAWFAGAPVDAVVELTRPVREHSLVLVSGEWTPTDASGGALWSHRRAVSSAVVHGTVEDLPVVSADLSRIVTSVQDLSSIVARASAHHSDIVAIRDAKQWNRKSVVSLIERLRDSGKRVVLFTDTAEALGELATMDATVAVVADQHDQAVVGTRGGDSWSRPCFISRRRVVGGGEITSGSRRRVVPSDKRGLR